MASDIKQKSVQDLEKDLSSQKEGLRKFRFGIAGSKTKNVKEGGNTKKNIARIYTELCARKK